MINYSLNIIFFKFNYFIWMQKNYYDYTCTRWAVFSLSAKRSIRVMKHELPFSIDLIPIDVRIHTFFNKTRTNNFPIESFSLQQFLLIVLSVKVTYIRNGCLAWVAYSQGRALDDSRAILVIESGPSIMKNHLVQNMNFAGLGANMPSFEKFKISYNLNASVDCSQIQYQTTLNINLVIKSGYRHFAKN